MVLKHLINTLPGEADSSVQRIALSLQDSLGDNSIRQMAGAVVALMARPNLSLLPSQRATYVRFMVSTEVDRRSLTEVGFSSVKRRQRLCGKCRN